MVYHSLIYDKYTMNYDHICTQIFTLMECSRAKIYEANYENFAFVDLNYPLSITQDFKVKCQFIIQNYFQLSFEENYHIFEIMKRNVLLELKSDTDERSNSERGITSLILPGQL